MSTTWLFEAEVARLVPPRPHSAQDTAVVVVAAGVVVALRKLAISPKYIGKVGARPPYFWCPSIGTVGC